MHDLVYPQFFKNAPTDENISSRYGLELARQGSLSGVVTHIKVRVRVQFVDHRSDLGIFGISYQRNINKRMMKPELA